MTRRVNCLDYVTDMLSHADPGSSYNSKASGLLDFSRLSGSRAGPAGFSGTLYDGGCVLQQLRDKVFAVCVSQTGGQSPADAYGCKQPLKKLYSSKIRQHCVV